MKQSTPESPASQWPRASGSIANSPRRAPGIAPTDGERLMRFRRHRDESAFAQVVDAHAVMVWGVCWQVLRHRQDVEDAFQATFLILARKASTIRANDSAAAWLYRVALRTSLDLRQKRRRRPEQPLMEEPLTEGQQLAAVEQCEQRSALLEELNSLPDRYQQPLVLHYLEGMTRRETAEQLGWSEAAVKGKLARGRQMLRTRLARRGVALSAAMTALSFQLAEAQASVSPALIAKTTNSAFLFTSQPSAPVDPASATLAKEGLQAMSLATASKTSLGVFAAGFISLVVAASTAEEQPSHTLPAAAETFSLAEAANAEAEPASSEPQTVAPVATSSEQSIPLPAAALASSSQAVAQPQIADSEPSDVPPADAQFVASQSPGVPVPAVQSIASSAPNATTQFPHPGAPPANPALYPTSRPTPTQAMHVPIASATSWITPSEKQLRLEMDYWQLKAKALEQKAEAMMKGPADVSRTRALSESGAVTSEQVSQAELALAEAMLIQAEVKLCESKAAGIEHQLEMLAKLPEPASLVPHASVPQGVAPQGINRTTAMPQQVPTPATQPIRPVRPVPSATSSTRQQPVLQRTPKGPSTPRPAVPPKPESPPTSPASAGQQDPSLVGQIKLLQQQNRQVRAELSKVVRALEALNRQHDEEAADPDQSATPTAAY